MQPLCYHSPSFVLRMNLPYHLVIFFNSKKIDIYIQCIKILFLLWEVSAISFFRGEGGDLFFFFSFSVKELSLFSLGYHTFSGLELILPISHINLRGENLENEVGLKPHSFRLSCMGRITRGAISPKNDLQMKFNFPLHVVASENS